MESYVLEKTLWDDADFDVMGWHDATIWSMLANTEQYQFLLDLDYIFEWVYPSADETYFKFWVSPVTMVFDNVHSIELDIKSEQGAIEIADLHRSAPVPTPNKKMSQRDYKIECQEGQISMTATGFRMFVRQAPRMNGTSQCFSLAERGGVSFEQEYN